MGRPGNVGAPGWALERFDLMLDRRSYNLQQVFPPEGLGEKTRCAPSHRFVAIRLSCLRGDEYDRHTIIGSDQFVLNFQAVNAWQLYIENQEGSVLRRSRRQKLLGHIE